MPVGIDVIREGPQPLFLCDLHGTLTSVLFDGDPTLDMFLIGAADKILRALSAPGFVKRRGALER